MMTPTRIRLANALPDVAQYAATNTLKQAGRSIAYGLAFGSQRGLFSPQGGELKSHRLDGFAEPIEDCMSDEALLKTKSGKPYNNYADLRPMEYMGNMIVRDPESGSIVEFLDCRINVTQNRNITETPLVGRMGAVKEMTQVKDYIITVSGNLIYNGKGAAFPIEELKEAISVLSTPAALDISCVYLNCFGINKVISRNIEYKEEAATYLNALPFIFTFISDFDYDFLII